MKDSGKEGSTKDRTLKDKASHMLSIFRWFNFFIFLVVFVISVLACVPNAQTAVGQNLFIQVGSFITIHNQSFFLIIAILCFLEFVSLLLQFHIKQDVVSKNISDIADEMVQAFDENHKNHDRMINMEHDLEIKFIQKQQSSICQIERSHNVLQMAFVETQCAYKDSLRDYYDSNKQIYIIVRNTQLDQIREIHNLIDTYCKI